MLAEPGNSKLADDRAAPSRLPTSVTDPEQTATQVDSQWRLLEAIQTSVVQPAAIDATLLFPPPDHHVNRLALQQRASPKLRSNLLSVLNGQVIPDSRDAWNSLCGLSGSIQRSPIGYRSRERDDASCSVNPNISADKVLRLAKRVMNVLLQLPVRRRGRRVRMDTLRRCAAASAICRACSLRKTARR